MNDEQAVVDSLNEHYGEAARRSRAGVSSTETRGSDAGAGCVPTLRDSPGTIGSALYTEDQLSTLPQDAIAGSIGCANPVALADLRPGEDVLDLGSGGGIDVLLSAQRVGPDGRAYGVDMTPEMLELARANQVNAGVSNAEFLEGRIEAIPLPDRSVDVVLSNCVITLSVDKAAVFAETHRVLRPGGRLAIADVVADAPPASEVTAADAAWAVCATRALTRGGYRAQLEATGFTDIAIADSHPVAVGYWSVLVRARKPPDSGA